MMSDASPTEAASSAAEPSAIGDMASHLRLWLVAGVGLAADLLTKHWAFTRLPSDPMSRGVEVIPRLMSFNRSLNPGALFGLGKGYTIVFIIASILALAFVLFLFVNSSPRRWSLHVALGLVLAGALGNLYDRAFSIADVVHYKVGTRSYTTVGRILEDNDRLLLLASWPEGQYRHTYMKDSVLSVQHIGVVRDFIRMEPRIKIGSREFDIWPWVFNIADALLVFGVGLLMLNFWRERRHEAPPPPDGSDQSAAQQVPPIHQTEAPAPSTGTNASA